MAILLTGGAGYIGSHTAVELINNGFEVIIVDNYSNSSPEVVKRIEEITGKTVKAYEANVMDFGALNDIFVANSIEVVIHFAGLKAVGESIEKPLAYYRNNIDTTLTLLSTMAQFSCKKIVFSSSATVYGKDAAVPCVEAAGRGACSNPYGWTKAFVEQILTDACVADPELTAICLRYFNPIGAHESGRIGEAPQGIPNNLMPYISQVAIGKRDHLTVFGYDYPTADGTCRRDYIHVVDLAAGHVKAVEYALNSQGFEAFNLGIEKPYSVLEIIEAFEDVNNVRVAYKLGDRREGDLPEFWADATKANQVLGWKAARNIADMCRDTWNWQKNNPNGYGD